jgi:hypothetical protein
MTRLFTQERFYAQVRREYWYYVEHVKFNLGQLLLIQQLENKTSVYIKN